MRRSPVALSQEVTRELQYRFRLAIVTGTAVLLMVWIFTGFLIPDGPPSAVDAAIGGMVFAIASIAVFAIPFLAPRRRRALEMVYWAAAGSARRSAQVSGERRIPATPAAAMAWLERNPDTDATRSLRIFCQLVIGNLPAARELAERMPQATPLQQMTSETSAALIRLVDGLDPGIERLRQMAATLGDDDAQRAAEVDAAMLAAITAAADGEDWTAPMLLLRERIGPTAGGAWRTFIVRFWIPTVGLLVAAAVILAVAAFVVRAALR